MKKINYRLGSLLLYRCKEDRTPKMKMEKQTMESEERLESCKRCGQAIPQSKLAEHLQRSHNDFSLSGKGK